MNYLTDHNPFSENNNLFNISNGMTAHPRVDVDNSKEIGEHIIQMMVGKSADDFTFRQINQAITLADKSAIRIRGEEVKVDPQLIFQRLATVGERTEELASIFKYELCTYPPALFDSSGLPLEANKAVLAEALWKMNTSKDTQLPDQVYYVLDGGALIHRIPWPRGSTFESICEMYVKYVKRHYGLAAVVFDGYSYEMSTKRCNTHKAKWNFCRSTC